MRTKTKFCHLAPCSIDISYEKKNLIYFRWLERRNKFLNVHNEELVLYQAIMTAEGLLGIWTTSRAQRSTRHECKLNRELPA